MDGLSRGRPTVTITAGGITTVTARVVDDAGNASGQTATAKVYIDPARPMCPVSRFPRNSGRTAQ